MAAHYYNEFNPEAAAMIRQMMADGLIPHGEVDTRSITEVSPDDLRPFTQCHFFAGIAGWQFALQLAGWPADRPVWTGSAPCQPFSSAGRQKGKDDERHLFPAWLGLIRECRPPTVFGEQVASAVAHGWLDDVYQGLEAEGYAVGAAVLPACSVGAPHRRDRLWFVAHAQSQRIGEGYAYTGRSTGGIGKGEVSEPVHGCNSNVANPTGTGPQEWRKSQVLRPGAESELKRCCGHGFMDNTQQPGLEGYAGHVSGWSKSERQSQAENGPTSEAGFWNNGEWFLCPDQKYRLVEPSIPLLAHGLPHRRPILHALGNAIVPQVAAEFIKAGGLSHA